MANITIEPATVEEAEETLSLQRLAYQSEAELYNDWSIPPLTQTLESLQGELSSGMVFLSAKAGQRLVGSVRAKLNNGVCDIGRLIVHPDFQGQGIGTALLAAIEAKHPGAIRYEVFTGHKSEANLRLYRRHGYVATDSKQLSPAVTLIFLSKEAHKVV